MEKQEKDGLAEFRKWLVPILLSLITVLGGVLGSNVMEAIRLLNVKVDAINQVINKQSVMETNYANLKDQVLESKGAISDLRKDLEEHKMYSGDEVMKGAQSRLNKH